MKLSVTELTVSVDEDVPDATHFLSAASGLSKTRVKDAMKKGAVWLQRKGQNKRLRRATAELYQGDKVSIYYSDQIIKTEPIKPELIAHEDKYSLWFKPPGLLSSGSRFGDHCAINRWVESHSNPQRPVFLVHRLDRSASGIMLLAHTKQVAANLSRQFHDREVVKKYRVEVSGRFADDCTIESPLDNKRSITRIKVVSRNQDISVLDVIIETGRKHQIRRHLSEAGHPVIGDRLYGGIHKDRLHLVACYLSFQCPLSEQKVTYQLPEHYFDFSQGSTGNQESIDNPLSSDELARNQPTKDKVSHHNPNQTPIRQTESTPLPQQPSR